MKELTCIVCPNGCLLNVDKKNDEWIVEGNLCPKGIEFAINEMTNAKRSICSTVNTIFKNTPRLPVRTDGEIPKKLIFPLMKEINAVTLERYVTTGEIIIENVLNTGINVIATSDIEYVLQERAYE
ncbi:MAG: molybdopterin oxidoreductase [Bacteroidetes bacterium 4572_77]|nr:MAG: molybdopterin oxidoreductase [Bacteroidetes bacterium 4572_77]